MRAYNPALILLSSSSAAELDISPTNIRSFDAQRVGAIPTSWLLLQVGSTLSAPITSASSTSFSVADTSKFRVNDLVVVDDEKCLVTAVSTTITVKRGYAGSTATTHASGTRIAAVVSGWPYAATLDMTANCPLGRATGAFATPGTGTERASDWLARTDRRNRRGGRLGRHHGRRLHPPLRQRLHRHRGVPLDRRSREPDRPGRLHAFDQTWQAGIEGYLARVRSLTGTKLVMTNGAPPVYTSTNGTCFECFPTASTDSLEWHRMVVGPTTDARGGSYLDWSANAPTPNLTTMFTMGERTDYRFMRFGLTSALMGDGYFSYKTPGPSIDFKDWWYDEYDNAGAGTRLPRFADRFGHLAGCPAHLGDLLGNYGGFADTAALNAWTLYPRTNYAATKSLDSGAAKIAVTQSAGTIWGVQFSRPNIAGDRRQDLHALASAHAPTGPWPSRRSCSSRRTPTRSTRRRARFRWAPSGRTYRAAAHLLGHRRRDQR